MIWIALPGMLLGQGLTTGRITGHVVDEAGQPVNKARVSLLSPALQGERITCTDTDGRFLAALLPVGPYAVNVVAPGKNTVTVSLRVTIGGTELLRLRLEAGEDQQETITVLGKITPLETTVVGENFNYSTQVEELPISIRDIETVARLSPNVSRHLEELKLRGAPAANHTVEVSYLDYELSVIGGEGGQVFLLFYNNAAKAEKFRARLARERDR